jgi:hypothetical protein
MRPRWLVLSVGVVVLAWLGFVLAYDPLPGQPCPAGARSVAPRETHLAPAVVEHQNWVGVPRSELPATGNTWVYACTGGVMITRATTDSLETDAATGLVEVKIPTRWVDLAWLSGNLEAYRDADQWRLVYTPGS